MNKNQKELIQYQLDQEKAVLDNLKSTYQKALNDINRKIRLLQTDELTQSKIYQIEYQKALKGQIEGILEKMHGDEYTSIHTYLSESYTDSFIGTMYDMHGQGIPLVMPIDQAAAVKAVQIDSQISHGLYTALGVDVQKLKKNITAEVTRGIASNMPYADIARNINKVSGTGYSNASRIVRTEGHRVQQASAADARQKAKDKGADVVKQWDSTLDGRTRSLHRQLDGQIREIDEPFEAGGMKAMNPGEFGDPGEDCNCRCVALTRARWALDESELQTLKTRAEFFGLDKTDSFEDYKSKYLSATSGLGANNANDGKVPDHRKPEVLKNIDFHDSKAVQSELKSFESKAATKDSETACVITKEGKVIHCFGVKDEVFPDSDLGDELIGAIVSHNHPMDVTSYTFSKTDVSLFLKYDLKTLRGCDKKYIYELTKDPLKIDVLPLDWQNSENYEHAIMIDYAQKLGIGYRRWLNE